MSTVQDAPATAPVTTSEVVAPTPFSFTAEAFRKMIAADVFADDERVELWEGQVCEKMAKKVPHANTSMILGHALSQRLPAGWFLTAETPVELGPKFTPLPDYCALRGLPKDYLGRHPGPADVGLVIELSDSSLRFDSTTKLASYAEAGVPVYWVVNLVKNIVQTYADPIPAERRYTQRSDLRGRAKRAAPA